MLIVSIVCLCLFGCTKTQESRTEETSVKETYRRTSEVIKFHATNVTVDRNHKIKCDRFESYRNQVYFSGNYRTGTGKLYSEPIRIPNGEKWTYDTHEMKYSGGESHLSFVPEIVYKRNGTDRFLKNNVLRLSKEGRSVSFYPGDEIAIGTTIMGFKGVSIDLTVSFFIEQL